jgi:NADH dehydrogenase (ubiquinone) 1 beta subcomplex subunit 2
MAVKPVEGSVVKRAFTTSLQRRGGGLDGWVYRRQAARPEKGGFIDVAATLVMTYIYWWIFWHLFTEPGHVFGEWEFPDPTQWTDEELGIPPDDYEG